MKLLLNISDIHGMKTTVDTFIYLQRDIEQSFQHVQTTLSSSHYDQQELDHLFNHISCTLDDIGKINQLIDASPNIDNHSVNITSNVTVPSSIDLYENENDFGEENTKLIQQNFNTSISIKDQTENEFLVDYSKENKEPLLSSTSNMHNTTLVLLPSNDEREDFIRRMKQQYDFYKNKIQSMKKETHMEIIELDQVTEDEKNQDAIIRQQDEHLDDMHHSIISLKNLTQNINTEINSHLRVLDNLETGMVNSQDHAQSLTHQTKTFIRKSTDGVGGHTCLFAIAVGLFFLIVILIIFF